MRLCKFTKKPYIKTVNCEILRNQKTYVFKKM